MDKKAAIRNLEETAKRKFGKLLNNASNLMKKTQVDLRYVKLAWSGFEEEMSDEAHQASDIPSFLLALRENQGPYAYRNLKSLLISFCGEEGEELVAEYEEKLKGLLHRRMIPTQRNGKKFIVKIDGRLDERKELDFRNTLAKLFKCSPKDFLLEDIGFGSTSLEGKCTCDYDIPSYTTILSPTGETLTPDDAVNVLDEILEVENKSYIFGLKLKLPPKVVDSIHATHSEPRNCLVQVLIEFTKQKYPRPTWRAIVAALRSPAVNLPQLAMKVEAAHCPDPTAIRDAPLKTTT